LSYWGQYLIKF